MVVQHLEHLPTFDLRRHQLSITPREAPGVHSTFPVCWQPTFDITGHSLVRHASPQFKFRFHVVSRFLSNIKNEWRMNKQNQLSISRWYRPKRHQTPPPRTHSQLKCVQPQSDASMVLAASSWHSSHLDAKGPQHRIYRNNWNSTIPLALFDVANRFLHLSASFMN